MDEVVIERPRYHHSDKHHFYRTRTAKYKYDPEAMDDLPKKQGMRRPYSGNRKQFSDLLGPLESFLISRVGRPWNDVYSEICENIKPDSTVQIHILGHVDQFVEKNCWFNDEGDLTTAGRWGYHSILRAGDMYVHPTTGILERLPETTRYRFRHIGYRRAVAKLRSIFGNHWHKWGEAVEEAKNHHRVGFEQELHKINGIWYWSVYEDVPPPFTDIWIDAQANLHEKIVRRSGTDFLTGVHYYEGRFRSYKRQANRRDLRRNGLKNDG
jgi:hypothetical protein